MSEALTKGTSIQDKLKSEVEPSRHMMALFTFIALLPLVYFIPPIIGGYTHNHLLVTVMSVGIIVPIISYGLLPLMITGYKKLSN